MPALRRSLSDRKKIAAAFWRKDVVCVSQFPAYVAEASGLQQKFWPVHDLIFEHQEHLSDHHLLNYANTAGVDLKKLGTDIRSAPIVDKVEKDMIGGARSGVNGTPTFFINGKRHDGYYEYEALKEALEKAL
jgi:protein-disulfide isomerase